jgi:hypothetical protein
MKRPSRHSQITRWCPTGLHHAYHRAGHAKGGVQTGTYDYIKRMRAECLRLFVIFALAALSLTPLTAGYTEGKELSSNSVTAPPPRPTIPLAATTLDTTECPESELMAISRSQIPRAEGVNIAAIIITHCRNGYARILLKPTPQGSTDDLPVFLHKDDGHWRIIGFGTGLNCSYEEGLTPETLTACRALGPP